MSNQVKVVRSLSCEKLQDKQEGKTSKHSPGELEMKKGTQGNWVL